jgi:hypothetical protein
MTIDGKVNRVGLGVMLVVFSIAARTWLEEAIRGVGLVAITIDGRSPEASGSLRAFQGDVVVVGSSSEDVSFNQTVREVGRVRPNCLVLAVEDDRQTVFCVQGRPLCRGCGEPGSRIAEPGSACYSCDGATT